jgi:2-oxoglutarate ferredoxin oxidoreductase subunit gamma
MVQQIYDTAELKNSYQEKNKYLLPATAIATEELRSAVVTNMVMLGALSAITNIISIESLINATKETVQKRFLEINLKGIEIGYQKGIEIKG